MALTYEDLTDPEINHIELKYISGGLLRVERLAISDYVRDNIEEHAEEIKANLERTRSKDIGSTDLAGTLKRKCHAFPRDVVLDGKRLPAVQKFNAYTGLEWHRTHVPEDRYFPADIPTEEGGEPIYAKQDFHPSTGRLTSAFSKKEGGRGRYLSREEISAFNGETSGKIIYFDVA